MEAVFQDIKLVTKMMHFFGSSMKLSVAEAVEGTRSMSVRVRNI